MGEWISWCRKRRIRNNENYFKSAYWIWAAFFEPFEANDDAYISTSVENETSSLVTWGFSGKMGLPNESHVIGYGYGTNAREQSSNWIK